MAAESRQPRAMRLLRCAGLALLLLLAPGRSTEEEGGAEGEGEGDEGGEEGGAEEVAPQSSESRYDLQ